MEAPVNEDVGVFSTIAVTSYCRKGAPMISIRSQIVQAPVDRLAPLVTLFLFCFQSKSTDRHPLPSPTLVQSDGRKQFDPCITRVEE